MASDPLTALAAYSRFLAQTLEQPGVRHSTVSVWSDSPYTGIAEGEVLGPGNVRLRLREELDFAAALITSYGYEFYRGEERLFWYDDFPHPDDPSLAATFPHHKHLPPDIRHHRVPAPELSFSAPNLPFLLRTLATLAAES
jgi:hypothetical protein